MKKSSYDSYSNIFQLQGGNANTAHNVLVEFLLKDNFWPKTVNKLWEESEEDYYAKDDHQYGFGEETKMWDWVQQYRDQPEFCYYSVKDQLEELLKEEYAGQDLVVDCVGIDWRVVAEMLLDHRAESWIDYGKRIKKIKGGDNESA